MEQLRPCRHRPSARLREVVPLGAALLFTTSLSVAGGLAISSVELTDNGDNDGFADTQETVDLRLTVQNTTGAELTAVALRLVARDPGRTCLTTGSVSIPFLGSDETQQTPPFVFTVSDVDRATLGLGPYEPLTATFDVYATALPFDPPVHPSEISIDLDLDVVDGSSAASFFEGFEEGLGAFEAQNLDQGRSSLAASDGYRCQYLDPDFLGADLTGAAYCYLGDNPAQADAFHWGMSGPAFSPDGGRGFDGFHSLFFGIDLGFPENWTTPLNTLEAVSTTDPINVGLYATDPTLTIKHQVSFADSRLIDSFEPGQTMDRGVVQVQLADAAGDPAGPWMKIDPYQNPYDARHAWFFHNCAFDPTDDGSTEDDFFAPTDPHRRYGPSSTCYPEPVFARIGETSSPFTATHIGHADGPGLQGLWGVGTWIESKFDLSRFRGQRIRVRFLASTLRAQGSETWEDLYLLNPDPVDDGWWIDNVEVTGTLLVPAVVTVDTKNNGNLPAVTGDEDADTVPNVCDNCGEVANPQQSDVDFDGIGDLCDQCPFDPLNVDPDLDAVCGAHDNCPLAANPDQTDLDDDEFGAACDCDDGAATVHPGAVEINDGLDNQCEGDAGHGVVDEVQGPLSFSSKTQMAWVPQAGATKYAVARSPVRSFATGCTYFTPTQPQLTETATPGPGTALHYLVTAIAPHLGSWGQDSAGAERPVACD